MGRESGSLNSIVILFILSLVLTSPLTGFVEGQGIHLDGSSTIQTEPIYDGYSRYWRVEKKFSVAWFEDVEVYFKIQAAVTNQFYRKGNVSQESGWFVRFSIADQNGTPLEKDAKGNPIESDLGVRSDDKPTDTVWIRPDTVYTMVLDIHVPGNLEVGSDYPGTVLVCVRRPTTTGGSGGSMDEAEEVLVVVTPSNSYLVYGAVTYKGSPVGNATVTLKNTRTGESATIYSNDRGYYSFDLSSLMRGWKRGDKILVKASSPKGKASKEVALDIERNTVEVNLELYGNPSGINYALYIGITILIIFIAILLLFKTGYLPMEKKEEKENKAPRRGPYQRYRR